MERVREHATDASTVHTRPDDEPGMGLTSRTESDGMHRGANAALFQALSDHATDLVLILEANGTIRYASPSHQRLLGYRPSRMEGHNAAEFVHPDDLPAVRARTVATARTRDAVETMIFRFRHADGSWRTLEAIGANRLRDPAVRGWIVTSRDITQRAQMEAALHERERQLGEAQRVAHIGSFEWDAVSDRVSWSDELYRIYGLDPQSFGATFEAFVAQVHPDDRAVVRDTIQQAISAGGPFRMQERIVRPDGEIRHLSSWGEVLLDAQGRPVRLVGICQDVTAQRRQEAALRASEARFRRLVEANIIGVMVADFDGAIGEANDAFLQMVGYSREDVASGALHWRTLTPPAYRDRDAGAIRALRTAGRSPAWETEYIAKDGRRVPVLVGAAMLDGTQDSCIAFVLDLTERKRVETEVLRLNETLEQRVAERTAQLREANEQLEAFSYSVSHDLRAPLRAMQGFAAALVEDYAEQLDEDGQEYARRIEAAAARMDLLIADLLAYSRLSRAALTIRPVALDVAVASALAQVDEDMRRREAQVQVPPDLPWVRAHHATLVQVLANLLTNAAKFVPPRTLPAITVGTETFGAWTRLWVADNGIGIAPEHRERIFGVFERLHGVESYPGTGIGLAIVWKGMERMGGRVGLESTVGRGSRFWIELPTAKEGSA